MELSSNIINSNKNKLYIYMFIITIFIGFFGFFISTFFNWGLTGTGCFLIGAGIVDFVAYYYSDTLVLKSTNAIPLREEVIPDYFALVRQLCENNNLKFPRLYMIDDNSINAFATGRDLEHSVVVVSKGLLEKLTPEEISGVVGHELAHIETGDMRLMAVVSILAGCVSILADMFWHSNIVSKAEERDNSGVLTIIGLVLAVFAPLTSALIKLAISRTREYTADARGAQICGNPKFLASALNKIKHDRIPMPHASSATAHLYFASPFKADTLEELMSTHPNIDERIKRLETMQF